MESLRELYKIGSGPSGSHTIAPQRAVSLFFNKNPKTASLHVVLYGSLSFWQYDFPNGLTIEGFDSSNSQLIRKSSSVLIWWWRQ